MKGFQHSFCGHCQAEGQENVTVKKRKINVFEHARSPGLSWDSLPSRDTQLKRPFVRTSQSPDHQTHQYFAQPVGSYSNVGLPSGDRISLKDYQNIAVHAMLSELPSSVAAEVLRHSQSCPGLPVHDSRSKRD
jgi:hypothetical protein